MKKTSLILLSSILLLSACSNGSSDSSQSSAPSSSQAPATSETAVSSSTEVSSAETSQATSENTTSEAEISSEATSATVYEETLTFAQNSDLDPVPTVTFDSATNVYTVTVSATEDTSIEVSGTCEEGRIEIVANPNDTGLDCDVELVLNGLTISNSSASPIYYEPTSNKLKIKAQKGTENTITAGSLGGNAIESENNVEFKGKGSLTLVSGSDHGVKADRIEFTSGASISIFGEKDALHGKQLEMQEFSGELTLVAGKQAFDFVDDDVDSSGNTTYSGSLTFADTTYTCSGSISVSSTEGVFSIDNSFVVPSGVSIVATDASSVVAINQNEGADITLTVLGSLSVNSNSVATSNISAGTKLSI